MDVSKKNPVVSAVPAFEEVAKEALPQEVTLQGSQLIDTLVTLTGLPEAVAHDELDQILAQVGNQAGSRNDLTLNELRQALLLYLETFQPADVIDEVLDEEPLNAAGDTL
ncbi:MAG: hypothetical protein P4M08_04140 [Oligoflexia bacterium]|nr:hypothetical protein [Oligoflexia bacterium]